MAKLVPNSRPQVKREVIEAILKKRGVTEKLAVVGIRGYYMDTMGAPGKNDRGIYDDCICFVAPEAFVTFNGNVDPSRFRKGKGKGSGKGMASLKKGLYRSHKLGLHRGAYTALIQTGGAVTVIRDGTPDYEDTGYFGINIHRGGVNGTSSLGCQTIVPAQWDGFISLVKADMKRYGQTVMPYLLIDEADLTA